MIQNSKIKRKIATKKVWKKCPKNEKIKPGATIVISAVLLPSRIVYYQYIFCQRGSLITFNIHMRLAYTVKVFWLHLIATDLSLLFSVILDFHLTSSISSTQRDSSTSSLNKYVWSGEENGNRCHNCERREDDQAEPRIVNSLWRNLNVKKIVNCFEDDEADKV